MPKQGQITFAEAKLLAKELSRNYGLDVYVHTDPVTGYNLRFIEPIETVRNPSMVISCRTVGRTFGNASTLGKCGEFEEVEEV